VGLFHPHFPAPGSRLPAPGSRLPVSPPRQESAVTGETPAGLPSQLPGVVTRPQSARCLRMWRMSRLWKPEWPRVARQAMEQSERRRRRLKIARGAPTCASGWSAGSRPMVLLAIGAQTRRAPRACVGTITRPAGFLADRDLQGRVPTETERKGPAGKM
jgi:hypothetical protein